MTRISGLINTLNEAENIRFAVASLVTWCDEVLVVDQGSEDGTAEIARAAGARVETLPRAGWVEAVRGRSVEMTTGDWVLVLDADEIVHPKLGPRLREIAESGEWDSVRIPRRNIILGRWLRSGQWWPNNKRRFFRKGTVDIRPEIHRGLLALPGTRELKLPADPELALWHYSYHTLDDLVAKSNRYTSVQARIRTSGKKRLGPRRWLRATLRATWDEVIAGRAWRDGPEGIAVAVARVFDRFIVQAKEWDEPRARVRLDAYRIGKAELLGIDPGPAPERAPLPGEGVRGDRRPGRVDAEDAG